MDSSFAEAVNRQVAAEFYSSYLYLQMAAWFEERTLKGFAHWMRIQAREEACHALILFNHLAARGAAIKLGAIAAPPGDYRSVTDVFEATLKHEQAVSESFRDLVDKALEIKDHAARVTLEWFVKEQIEEEASASELLEKTKMLGEKPGSGLLTLDAALAGRIFTPPAPLAGGDA
ncbi:MAG: ferritin [Planctomycetota bacterium]|jgi:ferritin|nr:ferritin [Planctomycetota bacterium]